MRTAFAVFAALLLGSTSACDQQKRPMPDGCYYTDGQPVFIISKGDGIVLVPGEVKRFTAYTYHGDAVFEPGFLFDGAASDIYVHADVPGPRHYPLLPGASPSRIRMYWAAYGESEVSRGKPCFELATNHAAVSIPRSPSLR